MSRKLLSILGLVLMVNMMSCEVVLEEGVLVGTKDNFDEIINGN